MKAKIISFRIALLSMIAICIGACIGQDSFLDGKSKSNETEQIGKNILEIFEDSQGTIWFGTSHKGVVRYSPNADAEDRSKVEYITDQDGLCGSTVANIAEDKNGDLWFGTYSDMCIYQPSGNDITKELFRKFPKDGHIPMLGFGWKSVQTDREGDIYVNTHHGVFKRDSEVFTEMEAPIIPSYAPGFCSTPGKVSLALVDSNGNKWFRTDGQGVYVYNPREQQTEGAVYTHYTVENGLLSNNVSKIVEDRNGNIWIACFKFSNEETKTGGLCKYSPTATISGGVQFHSFKDEEGLYNNSMNTIYCDDLGNIWAGATDVGVYKIEPANTITGLDKFTLYAEPEGVDSSDGFSVDGLQSVLKDSSGKVWLGYAGGLFVLEDEMIVNVTLSDLQS